MGLNRFIVAGNVGQDPEKFESEGNMFAAFSLAENVGNDKDGANITNWYKVTAGGKLATTVLNHVKKGDKLAIDGKLSFSAYNNKQGEAIPEVKVWLNDFEFASDKK